MFRCNYLSLLICKMSCKPKFNSTTSIISLVSRMLSYIGSMKIFLYTYIFFYKIHHSIFFFPSNSSFNFFFSNSCISLLFKSMFYFVLFLFFSFGNFLSTISTFMGSKLTNISINWYIYSSHCVAEGSRVDFKWM